MPGATPPSREQLIDVVAAVAGRFLLRLSIFAVAATVPAILTVLIMARQNDILEQQNRLMDHQASLSELDSRAAIMRRVGQQLHLSRELRAFREGLDRYILEAGDGIPRYQLRAATPPNRFLKMEWDAIKQRRWTVWYFPESPPLAFKQPEYADRWLAFNVELDLLLDAREVLNAYGTSTAWPVLIESCRCSAADVDHAVKRVDDLREIVRVAEECRSRSPNRSQEGRAMGPLVKALDAAVRAMSVQTPEPAQRKRDLFVGPPRDLFIGDRVDAMVNAAKQLQTNLLALSLECERQRTSDLALAVELEKGRR